MSTLHIRYSDGIYDYPENSAVGITAYANKFLNIKVNSTSTAKLGLTSNTNASQYCKMSIRHADGNIYRLNRSSSVTYLSGNTPQRNGSVTKKSATEALTEKYTVTTGTKYGSQTYTTGANITAYLNTTYHNESRTSSFTSVQQDRQLRRGTRTVTYTASHWAGVANTSATTSATAQAGMLAEANLLRLYIMNTFTTRYKSQSIGPMGSTTTGKISGFKIASVLSGSTAGTTATKGQTVSQSSYTRICSHVYSYQTNYNYTISNGYTASYPTRKLSSEHWISTQVGGDNWTYAYRTYSKTTGSTALTQQKTRTTATRISETLCN